MWLFLELSHRRCSFNPYYSTNYNEVFSSLNLYTRNAGLLVEQNVPGTNEQFVVSVDFDNT